MNIYIAKDVLELFKQEENKSGLINRLLKEYYKENTPNTMEGVYHSCETPFFR